jgi:nitrite reductase/ring-hydroxylating ferredoxin subunit
MWHRINTSDDLGVYQSYGFETIQDGKVIECFLVKNSQGQWVAYKNSCPHQYLPLNWNSHQFLDKNSEFIVCAMHLALFDPNSGICLSGPCVGKFLTSLPIKIVDNVLWAWIDS